MIKLRYVDLENAAGTDLGVSSWRTLDQSTINLFAEATSDHQWIHVDEERAREVFGFTIAHGYLTLSMIPILATELFEIEDAKLMLNYGCERVRFTAPAPCGARVRLAQTISKVEASPEATKLTFQSTIELEGSEKPTCVAEVMCLVYPQDAS